MKKNNKKLIIIALIVCIAVLGGVIVATQMPQKNDNTADTTTTESTSEIIGGADEKTSIVVTPTEATTATEQGNDDADIKGKYWYMYDDENISCYAFSFGENDRVDVAFFGSETINGEDPEYTKGYGKYTITDSKIVISELPDEFPQAEIALELKGKKLVNGKESLDQFDELSLEHALAHFV